MSNSFDEFCTFYSGFDYSEVDLSKIKQHIDNVALFADATNCALAIYDNYSFQPIYMSNEYKHFFHDDIDTTHPDDAELVIRSSVIALQYFSEHNDNIMHHRLIRKYRARIIDKYCVVIEQLRPLELDKYGRAWLSLSMIDIAPEQSPNSTFEFKILNHLTGEIIELPSKNNILPKMLTNREVEILSLIAQGFLSKEISEKLSISVHTVSKHRQRILSKLNADTSIEAIKYASLLNIL
ncbi:MAG: response regulator transcription factor [Marinifilaceae bacterium]